MLLIISAMSLRDFFSHKKLWYIQKLYITLQRKNTRSLKNIWSFPIQRLQFWIFLERHSQSFALFLCDNGKKYDCGWYQVIFQLDCITSTTF